MLPMDRCYRCGGDPTERAHIFPAMLFPRPRPTNLPTVPSCSPCNQGFSEDERLFSVFVNDYWSQAGKQVWDEGLRPRLQHLKSAPFRRMLADSVSELLVPTGDERGWGNQFRVERSRVNRVLENMVRSMTYLHSPGRVLGELALEVGHYGDEEKVPPPSVVEVLKCLNYFDLGGVVDYGWREASDDPSAIAATVRFYGRRRFVIMALESVAADAVYSRVQRTPIALRCGAGDAQNR